MSEKPNLVLGAVDNYGFHEIAPFLVSLQRTTFDGHVCLFAGPGTSAATVRRVRERNVEVVRFSARFPFLPHPLPADVKEPRGPVHICNARYFLYYDYLQRFGDRFSNVLITDVRDVFFQRDPFDFAIRDSVHVAMENPAIPIGKCPWTAPWIATAFGEDTLRKLEDKPMSCSGTTLAPVESMKRYLKAMLEEIAAMERADAYLDQAAHNRLLHSGKLAPMTLLENFDGPILTVGSEPKYALNDAGELINRDGSIVALVHQYDRHPELAGIVRARTRAGGLRGILESASFLARRALRRVGRLLPRAA